MKVQSVPIGSVLQDTKNARRGDIDALLASLQEFGQHRPLVVQKSTNRIIVGNHLHLAAVALGWSKIDVLFVEDDDKEATRRALADNLVGDRAKWDDIQLESLLREVGTDVPGVDDKLMARILKDVDEVTVEPVFPIMVQPGEHYSYVLLVATNVVDASWLANAFELRQEASYKNPKIVGMSKVVSVQRFRELLPGLSSTVEALDE